MLSASKNRYSVDILDDCTGHPWSYGAKTKDGAFDVMTMWVSRTEAKYGFKVGTILIDNGELKSQVFDSWCATRGITVDYTAPHTSAHNGRGERLHLTLASLARTMRIDCALPEYLWDEFMASAAYLRARTPSRGNKTPYELLRGRKPNLSHLREIGARAFVLHPGDVRKMEPRSEECVLIGYGRNSKTYRCYHRKTHRVIESFHVRFIERKDAICSDLKPGLVLGSDEIPSSSAFDRDTPAPDIPASSSSTPATNASQKTTVEEIPDVEPSSGKEARKLRCSA